jgi:hypothetical protein
LSYCIPIYLYSKAITQPKDISTAPHELKFIQNFYYPESLKLPATVKNAIISLNQYNIATIIPIFVEVNNAPIKNAFPIKVRQYEKYQKSSNVNYDFFSNDIFIMKQSKNDSIINTKKYWIKKTRKYAASVRPIIFIASFIFSSFSNSKKLTRLTNGIIKGIKIKVVPAPPHSKIVISEI